MLGDPNRANAPSWFLKHLRSLLSLAFLQEDITGKRRIGLAGVSRLAGGR